MGLLTDIIEQHVEQKHKDEEQRRSALRQFYYDRIHDDNTDPNVREQLSTDYLKLLSPEAKKSAQKGFGLIGKLKQAFGKGPQPQTPQQPAQGPALAPQPRYPGQPAPQPQPTPADRFKAGPPGLEAPAQQPPQFFKNYGVAALSQAKTAEQQKADIDLKERIAEYAAQSEQKTKDRNRILTDIRDNPTLTDAQKQEATLKVWGVTEKPEAMKPVRVKLKDGTEMSALVSKGGDYFTLGHSPLDADSIDREVTAKPPSGQIRSVPHAVSVDDAKVQAQTGAVFKNQDGDAIELDKLPPGMGLQAMVAGDKMFWVPITPNQKDITVGNEKYAVTPYNISKTGQSGENAPVALGVSRTPTQRTSEQIAVNPVTGEITKNTLRSSSTPQTPGAAQSAPASAPAPRAAPPSSAPATPPPTSPRPAPQSGDIKGVPPGMYNTQLNRVIPVREAATQIFGDPSQPDLKPLKDFRKLADSEDSRKRLGEALRLTFNALNQATGGANVTAGAGPISVSAGGIGSVLQNYFGVPQTLADQQTKIMQGAMAKLTPEEREAYDATMSSFSTIVGLRSLTRASAAQSSVQAIEREMPVIGVNTFDSSQFADQLQRLAEVVTNGVKGIPPGMLDSKLVQRVNQLPGEMQKLKSGPAKAPASKSAPKTADDFFKAHPELAPK